MSQRNLDKAALRGEPSYVWRAGQERRLEMIVRASGERLKGWVLENGCGVGMYAEHLSPFGGKVIGLEYDFERAAEARRQEGYARRPDRLAGSPFRASYRGHAHV